ncbi:MAG: SEC-C domain-containing protein [Pseudanabaena sp. CAN_BIN31]|nr:SEC-C domain-containing protein [Pseudanabaena sp. CAN_BIN31]
MNKQARNESEIFDDLANLCTSSGYAHAIAYFCFRDNTLRFNGKNVSIQDVLQQFSSNRLVRTEVSTLIGLMYTKEIDLSIPEPHIIQEYIDKTDFLLKEIHDSMILPVMSDLVSKISEDKDFNPFKNGSALREAIFYSGESAYDFQYLELSIKKYSKDNDWFVNNKGYSINEACKVVSAITDFQINRINQVFQDLINKDPREWSILPAFIFNVEEISDISGIHTIIVKSVIESFTAPTGNRNESFLAIDDFNLTNAYPIIKIEDSSYLLFQSYSLMEALYETPFFWFNDDNSYRNIAMKHRGDFTEEFSADRLKTVFGNHRVFTNIDIFDSKNKKLGEIDVLVVFANRAIILQAKSKKLTISARKGNDQGLQDDFKKAIQNAYDQGFSCATFLLNNKYKLYNSESHEINVDRNFKEIYIFCVVSDHYPALCFQSRQFLNYLKTDIVMSPFVIDVFSLDVITEMLQTPLHFLSYINRRTEYADRIIATHELTILSYHLSHNLWMDREYNMMMLEDDISADLDLAMMSRRKNISGIDTPEGILTKFKNTTVGKIIQNIELSELSKTLDLGFMLLRFSENTIETMSDGIRTIAKLSNQDGKRHNFIMTFDEGTNGLIIHCSHEPIYVCRSRLRTHCEQRKYTEKLQNCFGVCLDPQNLQIKFLLDLDYEWEFSDKKEAAVKNLPNLQDMMPFASKSRSQGKVGRNEPCPCGSGKKYKKCCIKH